MTAEDRSEQLSESIRANRQPGIPRRKSTPRHIQRQKWNDERAELVQEGPGEKNPNRS
jgi:hypothetical protein